MPKQPNMNQMMKQVQQMQADMMKAQEQLKNEVVEASAGGGMVTVKVTGDLELREVRIDPEAVDPEDVEMLQDLVLAATNEALRSAQELAANRMGAVTGGLGGACGLCDLGLPGFLRHLSGPRLMFAPPVNRFIAELSGWQGVKQPPAQRLKCNIQGLPAEEALPL